MKLQLIMLDNPIADFGFDSSDLAEHLVAAIKAEESRPKIFDVEVEMEENNSIKITKIL